MRKMRTRVVSLHHKMAALTSWVLLYIGVAGEKSDKCKEKYNKFLFTAWCFLMDY